MQYPTWDPKGAVMETERELGRPLADATRRPNRHAGDARLAAFLWVIFLLAIGLTFRGEATPASPGIQPNIGASATR